MKDEKLEWKEEKRKEILKTVVFTVTERYSTSPDGQKGTYIVNEAPDWVIETIGDHFRCDCSEEAWKQMPKH